MIEVCTIWEGKMYIHIIINIERCHGNKDPPGAHICKSILMLTFQNSQISEHVINDVIYTEFLIEHNNVKINYV